MNARRCYQIEVTRTYDKNSWHEDLRRFYFAPGTNAEHTTFLFADTQIVLEEFLEDINNTLNTGETIIIWPNKIIVFFNCTRDATDWPTKVTSFFMHGLKREIANCLYLDYNF